MPALLLAFIVAGSIIYCLLILLAARRYLSATTAAPGDPEPISILKPLAGMDEGLVENLRSFFQQKYPAYEILFAVRNAEDAAVSIVRRLQSEYPQVPSKLFVTGEPPYANAKVYSLDRMLAAARYDLIVMSDSDVRVTPEMLSALAGEFAGGGTCLVTCPYRAVPGRSLWSLLEALGLNTEFLAGVLVARMLDGMKFALGPTIAVRRATLAAIGGFDRLKNYLAEDFVMGQLAAAHGGRVILSSYIIEHHIGSQRWRVNLSHRLRWNRSTRRSRPWGYIGQVFTNPIPPALLLCAIAPRWWPLTALAVLFRATAAWSTAGWILHDPLTRRLWYLLCLQDFLSFVLWVAGFFGNTILWRGRRYYLLPDGRFELR